MRREQGGPRAWAWRAVNLVQLGFTVAWTTLMLPVAYAQRVLSGDARAPLRLAAKVWSPGLLAGAGAALVVENAADIDWTRPYLLVANHQSIIDICVLFMAVPVPLRFLFSSHTMRWPVVGWYGRATDMPVIDRDNPRSAPAMLRHIARLLGEGQCVCLFPEGTRTRDGRMAEFKAGPFEAARRAGVPVLPVAVDGAGAVLPPQGLFAVRPGTIRVRFGTPIAAEADRNDLALQAQAQVASMLQRWRGAAAA